MLAELSPNLIAEVQRAAKLLAASSQICVLTGAGISAESGIPTFRDKQTGLWQHYRAEDLATPTAFERDPKLVWSWYQWRRQLVHEKTPNPAHLALAEWQQQAKNNNQSLTLVTQNVDDLHEQAGSTVTHLHGHLWRDRCHECGTAFEDKAEVLNSRKESINFDDELVTCQHCDGYIRPDIVWFGEALPEQAWQTAEYAAANCEVFISIGTSSLVYPAAGLAHLAKQNGAKLIEINPDPTPNTIVDITLAANAGMIMPLLMQEITALS